MPLSAQPEDKDVMKRLLILAAVGTFMGVAAAASAAIGDPVVSGHKSNNCSWLPSSIWSNWEPMSKTAIEMGVFSKSVTLRICRSL